ncbi:MAG: hypothetical protein ABJC63_16765, partial [Gemmatimonadales bacterium]
MSLVLYGRLSETVGHTTESAGPLSVVVKDPGVVHADDFLTSAKLVRVTIPAATIDALLDDPARSAPWRWTHHPVAANAFLRLAERVNKDRATSHLCDPDIVDLLAAISARPALPAR